MQDQPFPESFVKLPNICYLAVADFLPHHREEWHSTRRNDLIYIISGELTVLLPGAGKLQYSAGSGEVLLMAGNLRHRDIFKLRKGLKALVISYTWDGCNDFWAESCAAPVIKFSPEKLHEVRWHLEYIRETALQTAQFPKEALLSNSRLHTVLLLLYNILRCTANREPRSNYHPQELLKAAQNYIRCNYASPQLNRAAAAAALSVSIPTLSRAFERCSGYTFNEYLTEVRLEVARKLLRSNFHVSEVAARCGFADPGYFARVFKKVHGIPPSQYR